MNYVKKLITALLLVVLLQNSAQASFSDIQNSSPYKQAIEFLQSENILQGYPDGLFRPNNPVNRVEFLKIVLLGSHTNLDVPTPSGFPDLKENEWYSPYVKKAKQEQWIDGYPDGTFKPLQTVNKVEALKILAKVQGWDIQNSQDINTAPFSDTPAKSWYAPYVVYAKNHDFLEETGSIFNPSESMSRGKISQIVYKTLLQSDTQPEKLNPTPTPTLPDNTISQENFTPVEYKDTSSTFFNNVQLTSTIPNIFYKNEIYIIEGSILNVSYDSIFAFLNYKDEQGVTQTIQYKAPVVNKQFKIPVTFPYTGNFQLGIIPGLSGSSKVALISVLSHLPASETNNPEVTNKSAINISESFSSDKTTFNWETPSNEVSKITFKQGSKQKTFFFRQSPSAGKNTFTVEYKNFAEFKEGSLNYTIESATAQSTQPLILTTDWISSPTKTIQAVTHHFSEVEKAINISNIPEKGSKNQKITFSANSTQDIYQEAVITLPTGFTEKIPLTTSGKTKEYFGAKVISAGSSFTFSYTPALSGTYIIEINNTEGAAILNTPIYVSTGVPLIPDFFDLDDEKLSTTPINLTDTRNEVLKLINKERNNLGLTSVTLNVHLNDLAQAHSDDMVKSQYFGHIDLLGHSPEDRRVLAGIPMPVGENLAKSATITIAHEGLMRSGIHRNNIINPVWTQVGIGIKKDSAGYIYLTEEFSRANYSETDLKNIKNVILTDINNARVQQGYDSLQTESKFNTVAELWSEKMATQNFNSFTAPDGTTLTNVMKENGLQGSIQGFIIYSTSEKMTDAITTQSNILLDIWGKIGIGLQADEKGILRLTLLYAP